MCLMRLASKSQYDLSDVSDLSEVIASGTLQTRPYRAGWRAERQGTSHDAASRRDLVGGGQMSYRLAVVAFPIKGDSSAAPRLWALPAIQGSTDEARGRPPSGSRPPAASRSALRLDRAGPSPARQPSHQPSS